MAIRLPCDMALQSLVAKPVLARVPSLPNDSMGTDPDHRKWKIRSNAMFVSLTSSAWQIETSQFFSITRRTPVWRRHRHRQCSACSDKSFDMDQGHLKCVGAGSSRYSVESMSTSDASKGALNEVLAGRVGWPQNTRRPRRRIAVRFAPQTVREAGGLSSEAVDSTTSVMTAVYRSQNDDALGLRHGISQMAPAMENVSNGIDNERFKGAVSTSESEWYVPRVGDDVLGMVVSGNEFKLDVEIGAEHLGCMLSKDSKPLDSFRPGETFWDSRDDDSDPAVGLSKNLEFDTSQIRFVGDDDASYSTSAALVGSVLPLQVSGMTMSGKPLLSVRNYARRIAWHRVRQIHNLNEPFRVHCEAWDSDGLVFKVEGLRATLHREQLLNKSKDANTLKTHVGKWKSVLITNLDEDSGQIVLSEKRAWARIGSLVVGTVERVFPFGVEVAPIGTTLRAMIHISHISESPVVDASSVFTVGEKVKALIIKPFIAHRIALSTALLESTSGLMLRDKAQVFREAEKMAARFQSNISDDENEDLNGICEFPETGFANLKWLDHQDRIC